jgi:hypothetical protein
VGVSPVTVTEKDPDVDRPAELVAMHDIVVVPTWKKAFALVAGAMVPFAKRHCSDLMLQLSEASMQ